MTRTPRRILMTADPVGGVFTFSVELARALSARGVEVGLALLGGPPSATQREAALAVPGLRLFASAFRLEWMPDPWRDLQLAADWLLELRDRLQPDAVHLNHLVHGDLDWDLPVVLTGHSCVVSWWRAVHGEEPPPEWGRYRERVTRSLRAAHVVTAPSRAMLAELDAVYGPLRRTRAVPNGREPRAYYTVRKEPLILAAGRAWDRAKNVAALDRVAPRLPWPVAVAGDTRPPAGDGAAATLRHARALGRLEPRDLARWFAKAGVFAAPALYEPFGLAPLEAALSSCALVLGDIPSLRETWDGAATFVPPRDDEALRAALVELCGDESRRERLAGAARRRARTYLPEQTAAAYLDAYADAALTRVAALPSLSRPVRPAPAGAVLRRESA